MSKFTPIEDVMNIFDPNILWLYIPGFKGYEISTNGYIRSMKHYVKYPYGILIKPVQREPYKNSCDPLYELSDDNNNRVRIHYSQLAALANENPFGVSGYPRQTMLTNTGSRNKFVKNDQGAYVKVYNGPRRGKAKAKSAPEDKSVHYAKFTIVQDGTETLGMSYEGSEYVTPILPADSNSGKYYGNENARIIVTDQGENV